MDGFADPKTIPIPPHHRAIKPHSLAKVLESMKVHDYNVAYPVVVEKNGDGPGPLVDGRHRIEAAIRLGKEDIPYIYKPEGISSIKFDSLVKTPPGPLGAV